MAAAAAGAAGAASSLLLSFSSPGRSPAANILLRPPPPPHCISSSSSCCHSVSIAKQQRQLVCLAVTVPCGRSGRRILSLRCSSAATDAASAVASSERWLLEPAGDGDWRHIGYRVPRPGPIEIASADAVTVGRVPEKADIVIPVATVSGVHARLEKKDGSLLVTDMDSTNGTYINERKLVPGFGVAVEPGSLLIFGDIHLAMFRVRKMIVDVPRQTGGDDEQGVKTGVVSVAEETS